MEAVQLEVGAAELVVLVRELVATLVVSVELDVVAFEVVDVFELVVAVFVLVTVDNVEEELPPPEEPEKRVLVRTACRRNSPAE